MIQSAFSGLPTNLWICGFWRLSPKGDLYYSKFSDQIILVANGGVSCHHNRLNRCLENIAALQIVLRKNDPELPIHPRIWKELDTKTIPNPVVAGEFVQATGEISKSHGIIYIYRFPKSPVSWLLGAKSRFVT